LRLLISEKKYASVLAIPAIFDSLAIKPLDLRKDELIDLSSSTTVTSFWRIEKLGYMLTGKFGLERV